MGRKMGRPREVVLLLSLFVLLGALHGTRAQYDNYDYEDYDEADNYDFAEDENVEEEDYLEEDADASGDTEDGDEGGKPGCLVSWDTSLDSENLAKNGPGCMTRELTS